MGICAEFSISEASIGGRSCFRKADVHYEVEKGQFSDHIRILAGGIADDDRTHTSPR